jgi:hypothetical protein
VAASASISLSLDTYQGIGQGEHTITGASSLGATVLYDERLGTRNDVALVSSISAASLTPFTQVGDSMTYSFHLSDITAQNGLTPLYRVGFQFGSTAALRYETSTGTGPRLAFGSNATGNPFEQGTIHIVHEDWSPFALQEIRFADGNGIDVTLSLELVAVNESLYDYEMTVFYVSTISPSVSNSKSFTFTGVNGNQVTDSFHATNSSIMVVGDAYTVSGASLEFSAIPEPSTYVLLSGLFVLGVVALRRQRNCK